MACFTPRRAAAPEKSTHRSSPTPDTFNPSRRQVFPVYLHGRSRKGMPVLWERIGKVDMAKADELKLPLADLTPNYVFLNECVWRVILDKGEDDNDGAKVRVRACVCVCVCVCFPQ